jgi:hypothetical protein
VPGDEPLPHALLELLGEQTGREVRVEVGIRQNMEPLSDFIPAVMRGTLGPIEMGEDADHVRGFASLKIGADGSRIRLDHARFRWAKATPGVVKANFDGVLIAVGW